MHSLFGRFANSDCRSLRITQLCAALGLAVLLGSGCGGDVSTVGVGQGPAGPAGAVGATGASGATGSAGQTGQTGATGQTGTAGQNGTSTAATPAAPGTAVGTLTTALLSAMPQGNSVTVQTVADGADTVLSMLTPATAANPVGGFVGGGTGNKAIVGLSGFNGLKVSDIGGIEFDVKVNTGVVADVYINFIVDLDCNADEDLSLLTVADLRARRRTIVWNPNYAAGYSVGNGYTRYASSFADSHWNIVANPFSATQVNQLGLLTNPGTGSPLNPLVGYPFACIVDGVSADGGLPRTQACASTAGLGGTAPANCGVSTPGALLLVGSSGNLFQKDISVRRVRIRDRTIVFN